MNCWKILGIAPCTDKATIKKAFAKKVKENPPSKDARKYQELREAYDRAIASSHEKKNAHNFTEDDSEDEIEKYFAGVKKSSGKISKAELSKLRGIFGSVSFRDLKTAIGLFRYKKISFKWVLLYENFWNAMKLLKTFSVLFIFAVIALVRCLLICSEQ